MRSVREEARRGRRASSDLLQDFVDAGNPLYRIAQRPQLARIGTTRRRARGEALHVAHAVERIAQPAADTAMLGKCRHRIMTRDNAIDLPQW